MRRARSHEPLAKMSSGPGLPRRTRKGLQGLAWRVDVSAGFCKVRLQYEGARGVAAGHLCWAAVRGRSCSARVQPNKYSLTVIERQSYRIYCTPPGRTY